MSFSSRITTELRDFPIVRNAAGDKIVTGRKQRVFVSRTSYRRAQWGLGQGVPVPENIVRDFEAFHGIVIAVGLGVALWAMIAIGLLG